MAGKYEPLREYLSTLPGDEVCFTFAEIEGVIGAELPQTARRHTAWWANSTRSDHPQARAWMASGWTVGVDIDNTCVTFFRRELSPMTERRGYHVHTPRPTRYPAKLTLAVSHQLKHAIDDAAVDQDMTTSELVRAVVTEWLSRYAKQRRRMRKRKDAPRTPNGRVMIGHD